MERSEAEDVFDRGRDLTDKAVYSACYAPTTSMYFDQFGGVRACCQNTHHLLGNVRTQSIRQIWDGSAAVELRSALAERDLSRGCGFCRWQVEEGGSSSFARGFDRQPVREAHPRWPAQMEFALTNACNLQCVMCNGDWSSAIRAHREHRAALPIVYEDSFFEELAEFLPHLRHVNFLGGEPFLGAEPLRVMDMLADLDRPPTVAVTTNGTQWSRRIERICERLPMSFVVSLDAVTKTTYESIRVGADFDNVMANIGRFSATVDGERTHVSVAHCLMTNNYREFVDLLAWAEHNGISTVGVNSVVTPTALSLYHLGTDALTRVVEDLEAQDRGPARDLGRLRVVWDEQLTSLQNQLRRLEEGVAPSPSPFEPWMADLSPPDETDAERLLDWSGGRHLYRLRAAAGTTTFAGVPVDRPLLEVDRPFAELAGRDPAWFVGRPTFSDAVLDVMRAKFGAVLGMRHGAPSAPSELWTTYAAGAERVVQGRTHFASIGGELIITLAFREVDAEEADCF